MINAHLNLILLKSLFRKQAGLELGISLYPECIFARFFLLLIISAGW